MWLADLVDRLARGLALAASLIIVPLTLAMVYEVVSRYVFAAPTFWAFELSYMMMGLIFLFGNAYALQIRQHVTVDFINVLLPKWLILVIRVVGHLLLVAVVAWLTHALANYAVNAYRSGEGSGVSAWNPQIWPYRIVYVLGFALFALQILSEIVKDTLALLGRRRPGDGR